jgi:hypothetical protein
MMPAVAQAVRLDGRSMLLVRDVLSGVYDYERLDQDLVRIDRRLAEVSAPEGMKVVVFRLVDTATREGWLLELLTMLAEEVAYPEVKAIARRMLGQLQPPPGGPAAAPGAPQALDSPAHVAAWAAGGPVGGNGSAPVDPFHSHLLGQLLFVDRTGLRKHLRDLLAESPSRVLVVTGARPCGKSYTWYYVRHLADRLGGLTPVLVDLSDWAEASLPMDLMSSIALQLGLPLPKVDEHAQGAAQAQRLRDWLVRCLHDRDPDGRWLLVFDSLDHVAQREDTLQLIEFLAGAAIRQRLPGLRVILLGYADRLPIDPLESVLTEEVCEIGEPEIREFFQTLARLSQVSITDEALDLVVRGVMDMLPAGREQKLRHLARTIRAIGNAAFGRQVLP